MPYLGGCDFFQEVAQHRVTLDPAIAQLLTWTISYTVQKVSFLVIPIIVNKGSEDCYQELKGTKSCPSPEQPNHLASPGHIPVSALQLLLPISSCSSWLTLSCCHSCRTLLEKEEKPKRCRDYPKNKHPKGIRANKTSWNQQNPHTVQMPKHNQHQHCWHDKCHRSGAQAAGWPWSSLIANLRQAVWIFGTIYTKIPEHKQYLIFRSLDQ